jgi:hypothetical protein
MSTRILHFLKHGTITLKNKTEYDFWYVTDVQDDEITFERFYKEPITLKGHEIERIRFKSGIIMTFDDRLHQKEEFMSALEFDIKERNKKLEEKDEY